MPINYGNTLLSQESAIFGAELSRAVQSCVGEPFVNHGSMVGCGSQDKTYTACMETGIGQDGFDCSGLVIHGLSEVLDIDTTDWASGIRHVAQMTRAGRRISVRELSRDEPLPGLLYVFNHWDGDFFVPNAHVAVYVGNRQMVHARSMGTDSVVLEPTRMRGTSKSFAFAIDPLSLVVN